MSFLRLYGGWVILAIAIGIIVYLLMRPGRVIDNSAAQKKIDSIALENGVLRKSVTEASLEHEKYVDSTSKVIDSLKAISSILKARVIFGNQTNIDLAHKINTYIDHPKDTLFASSCIELAKKVIADSLVITDYHVNTDRLIWTMDQAIGERDSLIKKQATLIFSDSVLIAQQKALLKTQDGQIVKLKKDVKLVQWVGRALAVTAGVLALIVATK